MMNKISKNLITAAFGIIVMVACQWAGRGEYVGDVLVGMSDEKYQAIRDYLGNGSNSDIVDEYINRRHYWDSLIIE